MKVKYFLKILIILPLFMSPLFLQDIYIKWLAASLSFTVIFFYLLFLKYLDLKKTNKIHINCQNKTISQLEEIKSGLLQINTHINNKMKAIPVFTNQLNAVIEQTDEAANNLISSFININKKAKDQVKNINNIFNEFGVNDINNGNSLLDNNRNLFRENYKNISSIAIAIESTLNAIKKIKSKFDSINKIVAKIKTIATQTQILSLNALIESNRAGKYGKSFAVVADEVKTLSDSTNSSAAEIENIIKELGDYINNVHDITEKEYNNITNISNDSEKKIEDTLNNIDSFINNLSGKIELLSKDSESLSNDVSKIIVSIQFQDITRQRIEHVVEPLNFLNDELVNKLNNIKLINNQINEIESEKTEKWLSKFYTMESETEILKKVLDN